MRIRDLLSFIAFGVIIAIAITYIGSLGVRIGPPSDSTNLSMDIPDINSLVVGSNVLLRGVPVGKISNIEASVEGAIVDFYIDDGFQVPVDSDVRLENLSALGESYIGLVPRSEGGPMLRDGQSIATESVMQPPSVAELATAVNRVLRQLDPGALERIIAEANAALPDPNTVLPNLSRASTLLRNTAADMHGRGRVLLDNFQTLLRNAEYVGPALADIAPPAREIGRNIQGSFRKIAPLVARGAPQTFVDFRTFLDRIQKLLDDRAPDIKVLSEAVLPKIQGIAGALMNFDTGQILANVLAAVPQDGAITLHVTIPGS
jgi:phospholipid/cholesterol/gamma-HCH transport system substrate-binding protein